MNRYIELIARILLGHMFVIAGFSKISGYDGTAAYMDAMGVPGMLLPAVILLEIAGGVAIIVGFKTRIVAGLLAGFTVVAALIFHSDLSDQMQMIMFMKNFTIAGGLLLLVGYGSGRLSIDARRSSGVSSQLFVREKTSGYIVNEQH